MFLILLTIFAAISPNFAPTVPTLISTYTLEKGEEKVFVRHVKVEQINTQDLGQIVRECNGPGVEGFFSGGMNEFKLDWKKCEIMDGVDTLKMSIFYTKSGDEGGGREFEFKVELHNQQRIKTDYTFNMNMHGEGGRKNEGMVGEKAKESETVEGVKNEEKGNGEEMNGGEGRKEEEEEAKKANGPIEKGEIGQKEENLVVGNEGMNGGGGMENGGKEKQKEGTKQGEGEMKKGTADRTKLLPLKWDELMKEGRKQQKEAGKTNNIRTSSSI